MKEEVWEKLGINETRNIGKYLGFPILHKGANRRQYNDIVERVMNKLSRWKVKFLSFAGRFVLIKSAMAAIPNYVMQGTALPAHICDKLDKVNRNFYGAPQVIGKRCTWWVGIKLLNLRKKEG